MRSGRFNSTIFFHFKRIGHQIARTLVSRVVFRYFLNFKILYFL
ncbi:hypothetical protein CKA32_000085 [Geitlerinema sp. FC II]|nr:hypothetical protein CKA32_000085 [Geitlerinema sp. FC II]